MVILPSSKQYNMERNFYLLTCKIISHLDDATIEEISFYKTHLKEPFESLTIRRWLWHQYELLDLNTDLNHGVLGIKTTEITPIVIFVKDQITIINNTYPDLIDAIYFLYFIRRIDRPLLEPENNELNRNLERYDQSDYALHARIIEQGARKLYEIQHKSITQPILSPSIIPASTPLPVSNPLPASNPLSASNSLPASTSLSASTPLPASIPLPSKLIGQPSKPILLPSPVNKPATNKPSANKQTTNKKATNKPPTKPVSMVSKSKVPSTLTGQIIIFYGFQCPQLKADIEARGGKVTKNLSGVTTLLVMKDINATTNNVKRAEEQGVKLISKDDFIKIYIH
jgi:hypothetical protein